MYFKKCKSLNGCKKIKIRPGNRGAKAVFGRWLTNYNWTNLYHTALCEQKLELFQDAIHTGLDHFLPCKVVKMHDRDKAWITPAYKELIKSRQKEFFQKNDKLYRRLRNRANRESKNLKYAFLEHKLEQLKRNPDPTKWWDTVKQIAGYPKKKYFSSLVPGDQVVSTRLSYPLLEIFLPLALSLPLIPNYKAIILLFQPSTLLGKKTFIINYLRYHLRTLYTNIFMFIGCENNPFLTK
jgi:hypothetical protein